MWIVLPIVAFGSAYVPEVASFVAGQAMFTMMVLIIFNLIAPTGGSVGLIRVEDVVVGASVGMRGVGAAVAARRHVSVAKDRRRRLRGRGDVPEGDGAARHPRRLRGGQRPGHSRSATTR